MTGFRGDSSLSTWCYQIALNHCLKYAARIQPVTVPYDLARKETESEQRSPARQAARGELSDRVQTALNALSADHHAVVLLHEMLELTYAERAAVLQVPVGTVKSRLSTAFRRLRSSLKATTHDALASLVGSVSALLALFIWLLAYSPVWVTLLLAGRYVQKLSRKREAEGG